MSTQFSMVPAATLSRGGPLTAADLPLAHPGERPRAQTGGESVALDTLESFLMRRGENYSKDLSAPGPAWEGCSRLSTYLSWGQISLRHVYQRLTEEQKKWRGIKDKEVRG